MIIAYDKAMISTLLFWGHMLDRRLEEEDQSIHNLCGLSMCIMVFRSLITIFILLVVIGFSYNSYAYSSRLKDIVNFEGIRENILIGFGLVVGLKGTGDNIGNSGFTEKELSDFLGRMGINMKGAKMNTKNVASVTITATLPAFSRHGSKIDVTASTIGDAKSLEGGTLIATPLLGADGKVYAVAQGQVTIGGFQASDANNKVSISKGVPTSGFISNGATIEREIDFELSSLDKVNLSLKNPDITTAEEIAKTINTRMGDSIAKATDPSTVVVKVPEEYEDNVLRLLARLEKLEVNPDTIAKIIIDEASGTIVIGQNVRISPVGIAQGNLVVTVKETEKVSQPDPFAPDAARTLVVNENDVSVDEPKGSKMHTFSGGASLNEVVDGLNALGVMPRDLITILQNIKASGALQAEIESR